MSQPKNVCIMGKNADPAFLPFDDPDWEIWGLNDPTESEVAVCHRWFQLHPPDYMRKHYPRGMKDMEFWSASRGITLYMDRHYEEYPDSEPYPKEEVEALTRHGWYHASSFDWMMALAILEGFERVRLVSSDFLTFPYVNGEPISARPCLEYWCGVAEGSGMVVEVAKDAPPYDGDLFEIVHLAKLKSRLQYGFEREPGWDLSAGELQPEDAWEDTR